MEDNEKKACATHHTLVDDSLLEKVYRLAGANDRMATRINDRLINTVLVKRCLFAFLLCLVLAVVGCGLALHFVAESVKEVDTQGSHFVVAGPGGKVVQQGKPAVSFALKESYQTHFSARRRLGVDRGRAVADAIDDSTYSCSNDPDEGCISVLTASCHSINQVIDSLRTEYKEIMVELCPDVECAVGVRGVWTFAGMTNHTGMGKPKAEIIMWNTLWVVELESETGACDVSLPAPQYVIDDVLTRRRRLGSGVPSRRALSSIKTAVCGILSGVSEVIDICSSAACFASVIPIPGIQWIATAACLFCDTMSVIIAVVDTIVCDLNLIRRA